MNRTALVFAICVISVSSQAQEIDPHDVFGLWLTKDNEAIFRIDDCGDGSPCGAMVWMNPEITETYTDDFNPDPNLQGRKLIGAQVIWGFERGRRTWKNGNLYHAEKGDTYRAKIRRKSADEIVVKGCIGPICIGQSWTSATLPDNANALTE
ncbi:MAG: DUF2147 domain-containing protein [Pseudomonadota bacterium]